VFQRIHARRALYRRRWRFRPNDLISVDVPASRVHEVSDDELARRRAPS
jgi:hypothetical protein